MKEFDAIIIGSGQGGNPLAKKLAAAGWKTAIIEKRLVGGTCINDGCSPTKAMVASAKMAFLASNGSNMGVDIPAYTLNFNKVIDRKNEIVTRFRESTKRGLEKQENLELIMGKAIFTGDHDLKIFHDDGSESELTAPTIIISTGSEPRIPAIEGLPSIPYLTSTSIMELAEVPEHLVIIGAGYIGLEFGQMFRRFGSKVTIIEKTPTFLPKEDRDIAEMLREILEGEGIEFKIGKTTHTCEQKNGKIIVTLEHEEKDKIECTHILLTAGRVPQSHSLGLESTGIKTNEKGHIIVNEKLETTVKGVYAIGDVKGGPAFTHIAYNDYIVLYHNLVENVNDSTEGRLAPYCIFTEPQLARVGLTETKAKEQGIPFEVATLPMKYVARAIETGETRGMMKAIVHKATKQILGVAILGEQGGEIMSVLQVAMQGNISYETLRKNIFAHPLFAESINNLFMSLDKN